MRAALAGLALLLLPGCMIGDMIYQDRQQAQCDALPFPTDRLECERGLHDAGALAKPVSPD